MIILASGSPRRKKLLADAGLTFEVYYKNTDETVNEKMKPDQLVKSLALKKAVSVLEDKKEDTIIATDTVVVFNNEILGKPKDENDAYRMLKMLAGQKHEVYTGVAILSKDKSSLFHSMTEVWMKPYNDEQIWNYISTGEPMDKAGAYAIQDLGGVLVEKYVGDFFTIVGLPLKQLMNELKKFE